MSQLDPAAKKKLATILQKLRGMGKTILAVEHNLDAVTFADWLMVMENGALICFDRTETLLADRNFMNDRWLLYDHQNS